MTEIVLTDSEALALVHRQESHVWDHKSAQSGGDVVQKIAVAFANADGGRFSLGIEDDAKAEGLQRWRGYKTIEDSNYVHQSLMTQVDPPINYSYTYYRIEGRESVGFVLVIDIPKSGDAHFTAGKKCFLRRSAASREITGKAIVDLQLSKGAKSYEDQVLDDYDLDEWCQEEELQRFLSEYSPGASPEDLARRERLNDKQSRQMRVAAAILFAAHPAGVIPKRCGIKIARYATAGQASRQTLEGTPITCSGPARQLIEEAIEKTTEMINSVPVLHADGTFTAMKYPPEALKEIVVNAVIHRDYNVSDDVLISVFDNRVEVRSPGALPGHMTIDLLYSERASRNTKVLRLLNGYQNPLNKDIGEGLTTVRESMAAAKLREPRFEVDGNYFAVTLPHEKLARPEELVMTYLEGHAEITNAIGRSLTGIASENTMKEVFYTLRDAQRIERVPGKRGNKAAWQAKGPKM